MSAIAVIDEEEHHVDYEGEEEEEEEMGPSPALLPETREEEHHEKPSEDNTAKDEEDEGVVLEDDDTRVSPKKAENAAADAPAPVLGGFLQANNPNPRLDAPLTAARSTASTKPAIETITTTVATKTSRWGSRRGGIARPEPAAFYMPPAKRRAMAELERERKLQAAANHGEDEKQDNGTTKEADMTAQRENWEALKKAINGTINRLNANTIKPLIGTLFETANLIRGRGLLARSLLKAAVISPSYAPVYAALVAVLNTKLPEVGELILSRSILLFRRTYKRRDKVQCLAVATFLGHLFNQSVVHELLSLQILTVLLDGDPTDDSVEVAIHYLQVVGQALSEVSPTGVHAVMERFRALLHEGIVGKRVQYQMEALMAARKRGFKEFPAIPNELDLVESDDQITFELTLDNEDLKKEEVLDMFRFDDHFKENEEEWKKIRAEILGDSDSDGDEETDSASGSESEPDNDEEEEEEEAPSQELALTTANGDKQTQVIQDLSEADLVHLRRTIYLTIMSSATFEECAHKLMKLSIPDGREDELINMIIECCSQERTFLRYYGLISNRFCLLHDRWCQAFLSSFEQQYNTIHRLETNKLRNVAKLFAHLLHTDAMPWSCLSVVHMNEDETTSSSRIFVKILIQEMAEAMGMATLKERFDTANPTSGNEDSETFEWYKGMFPRDNVKHTRYAINFFTSIGLGPLTDGMREYLKNAPKLILAQAQAAAAAQIAQDDDRSTSSSSVSSTSSSSSSSSYTSSSSSSSYTSRSSRSSYSSRSRGRRRGGGGGGRGRKQKRSRSYSSRSRSSSRSSHSKRSGSRSYSRSPSRDRGRRRGRSDSRSYSRSVSYSRSPSRSPTRTKRDRSRSRDAKSPTRSKKRKTEASNAPDTKKKSVSRSVSRSPSPPRGGDRRSRSGGSKSRSYSNSRSRSPSVPKKSSKSNRRDPSPSRSRSKSVNEPNAKEDRGRSSSRSASSRSYTPSRSRSRSRN